MDPMVLVIYFGSYALGSALFALVPAALAKSKNKDFSFWWFISFCVLMISAFIRGDYLICLVPLAFLVILSIAARFTFPNKDLEEEVSTSQIKLQE